MAYPVGAVERAMKVQEVILRALSGQLTWLQAADILGRSPRSIRRLRWRYERYGYDGLFDRRRRTPSPRRAGDEATSGSGDWNPGSKKGPGIATGPSTASALRCADRS